MAYARATRPDVLEALTVNVDDGDTKKLMREWEKRRIPVPLKVIESPYREITKPVLDYVKRIRTDNPRDVVTVFIPEYVVGHWWEQILHNQSALRLKGRLLFQPGVMVTNVPWQLRVLGADRQMLPPGDPAGLDRGAATAADARPRRRPRALPADRTATAGARAVTSDRWRPVDWTDRVLELEVGAGRARRPLRAPATTGGSCSCGTRCPGSGCAPSSPRTAAARSAGPTPSRC